MYTFTTFNLGNMGNPGNHRSSGFRMVETEETRNLVGYLLQVGRRNPEAALLPLALSYQKWHELRLEAERRYSLVLGSRCLLCGLYRTFEDEAEASFERGCGDCPGYKLAGAGPGCSGPYAQYFNGAEATERVWWAREIERRLLEAIAQQLGAGVTSGAFRVHWQGMVRRLVFMPGSSWSGNFNSYEGVPDKLDADFSSLTRLVKGAPIVATTLSIEKWLTIAQDSMIEYVTDGARATCGLCAFSYDEERKDVDCQVCPAAAETPEGGRLSGCKGTPYYDFVHKGTAEAARAEATYLTRVLAGLVVKALEELGTEF